MPDHAGTVRFTTTVILVGRLVSFRRASASATALLGPAATELPTTDLGVDTVTDQPIPALLPRDWPRQLADALAPFGSGLGLAADAVLPIVDGWVLAAADALLEEVR